jgi:hypothetical protein
MALPRKTNWNLEKNKNVRRLLGLARRLHTVGIMKFPRHLRPELAELARELRQMNFIELRGMVRDLSVK